MFFLVSTLERNSIRCLFAKLHERITFELGRRRNAICAIEFMLALQETAKKGLYENGGNPLKKVWVCTGNLWVSYGLRTGKANPGFYLKPEVYQPNVWVCTGKVWVSYGLRTG